MKKIGYIILISVLFIGILFGFTKIAFENYKINKLEKHIIEEYNFEISYPKAYKDINVTSDDESELLSSIETTVSGEQISEYMQNLNLVKTVKNLKNEKNGIKLLIEAINIEKTKLTLEEICKRYVAMFKIYNEDQIIKESNSEIISIDGNKAGKVILKIKGKEEDTILIAYLLTLEEKEITITFIAPEKNIIKFENEINKIINSLKIY